MSASEPAFRALKLAGAAYLVHLGAHSLWLALANRDPSPGSKRQTITRSAGVTPARGLRQGAISNLGNPKMAVFFASLLPQFAPAGDASVLAFLALGLLFATMTLGWLTFYAIAVNRVRALLTGRIRRAFDATTGIVLVALGIRLAATER